MKRKRKRKPAHLAKDGALKSLFLNKGKRNGHVSLAEVRAFLNEETRGEEKRSDEWHLTLILDFWSKPYHELAGFFRRCNGQHGYEERLLDVARDDVRRLLQILLKGRK